MPEGECSFPTYTAVATEEDGIDEELRAFRNEGTRSSYLRKYCLPTLCTAFGILLGLIFGTVIVNKE